MQVRGAKTMIPVLPILTHGLGWIKTLILSSAAGWLVGETAFLAFQAPPPLWYESPLMISVVTAISVVMVQVLINLSDRRKQRLARESKEDEQHNTFSTRLQELTVTERKELLAEYKELYGQELRFEKARRQSADLQAVEARFRYHQMANALSTAQTFIFTLQGLLSQNHIEFPVFTPKTEADFEEGLKLAIEAYKQQIEDEIHKTG